MAANRINSYGYASRDTTGALAPYDYSVRKPLEDEVLIRVIWCGICHTDIHMAKNEWKTTNYPCVPGHEYVGIVEEVGSGKDNGEIKKGDYVGVGYVCDSCDTCESCKDDRQMHCVKAVDTFSGFTRGEWTTGGYAQFTVVRKAFVVKIPSDMPHLEDVAPLMCAGITTYSPIVHNNMGRGNLRIGVIGLGGLGHLAVQFAHKINKTNEVFVVSRSQGKEELAKKLGAKAMISTSNEAQMKEFANTFDYLLDTVAVSGKPMDLYMKLLRPLGVLVTVGLPPVGEVTELPIVGLVTKNCSIQGSLIGGVHQMQKMIEFCYKNDIKPMCEHVKLADVNTAFERILKSDVKFRFVIDVADSIKQMGH